MSGPIPSEVVFHQMLVSPFLLVALLGFAIAFVIAKLLNRTNLARYFWFPPLTFVALWVLMSALVGLWFIAP